jgi:AraC-like DNA-binding protein
MLPYVELPVGPALRSHVACTWIERSRPDGTPFRDRVLPDAWVDVIWGRSLWVRGPDTRVHSVGYGPRRTFVGLRLRRGAAPAVLGVPATELVDARRPLSAFWGQAAGELEERLAVVGDAHAARALLEEAVAGRIAQAPDLAVAAAVSTLARRRRARIRGLADDVGLSERQLRRRCLDALGYGPKTLDRILRLQRLRRLAATNRAESLARLAFAAGYTDQAHMTHECVRLAAETPSALVTRTRVRFLQDGGRLEP